MAPRHPRIQSGGWIRLLNGVLDDERVGGHGPDHFALWVAGLTFCNRNLTNGLIPKVKLAGIAGNIPLRAPAKVAASLVNTGAWIDEGTHWRVHNYLEYQSSREEVEGFRKANAERMSGKRSREQPANVSANTAQTGDERARDLRALRSKKEELDISDDNKRVLFSTGPEPNALPSRQASPPPAPHGSSDQEKPNESPPDQPRPVVADVVADQDKRPPAPSSSDPGRAARWRLLDAIADAAVKRQRSLPEGVRNEDAYRSGVITETRRESGALVDSVADAHPNAPGIELLSRFNAALSRSHLSPKRLTALEAEEATGRANRARDEANAQAEAQQAAAAQQRRDAVARARAELGPERCEELRAKAEEELLAAGDHMARSGARSTLRAMRIGAATDELILAAVGERTAAEPDRSPTMPNPRLQAVSA